MTNVLPVQTDNVKLLFAIHDSVANEYNPPVTFPSIAVAVRFFGDLCKKDPVISNHPSDFSLVWIGSFNCVSGSIVSLEEVNTVANATDFFTAE